MENVMKEIEEYRRNMVLKLSLAMSSAAKRIKNEQAGQGTTEYAILVGVLVVIAIIAVIAFRDNLQTLWDNISDNVNSL